MYGVVGKCIVVKEQEEKEEKEEKERAGKCLLKIRRQGN